MGPFFRHAVSVYSLGVELGLGFLVNTGNFHAPQAANFSSNGFYLVLRAEPGLQRLFFCLSVPTPPSALNCPVIPGHRMGSFSMPAPLLQGLRAMTFT